MKKHLVRELLKLLSKTSTEGDLLRFQTDRTTMATKKAVAFANIFMFRQEKKIHPSLSLKKNKKTNSQHKLHHLPVGDKK